MLGGVGREFGRQHFFEFIDAGQRHARFDRRFAVGIDAVVRVDHAIVQRTVGEIVRARIVFQLVRRQGHGRFMAWA
jgi:hypothetical protein